MSGGHVCMAMGLSAALMLTPGCKATTAPSSEHFDGRRFHNRVGVPGYTLLDEVRIAWELRTKKSNWPARFETPAYQAPLDQMLHGIRVLWIGHSGTLIQTPGLNIMTDPVLFDSIGPSVSRIHTVTNPGLLIDSLPHVDLILISHNHYDHLDLRSLQAIVARQPDSPPTILTGRGVGAILTRAGLTRYAELDWGDSIAVKGARVHFLEAIHNSRRGIADTNETLWGAYLIDTPEGRIYFAGDTAYGAHFRDTYEKFGAPRVSLLPIGAYEPRWFMYRLHMNPDEAVRAHLDLHSQSSIAIHFGLIDSAGESFQAPVDDLTAALRSQGVEPAAFAAPRYGQVFRYE